MTADVDPSTIPMEGRDWDVLRVTPHRSPTVLYVHVAGEMDIATAGQLMTTLRPLVHHGLQVVRLDVTDLEFIDAAGLTELLRARTLVLGLGRRLTLLGVRPGVLRLLRITDLLPCFDIEPDVTSFPDR